MEELWRQSWNLSTDQGTSRPWVHWTLHITMAEPRCLSQEEIRWVLFCHRLQIFEQYYSSGLLSSASPGGCIWCNWWFPCSNIFHALFGIGFWQIPMDSDTTHEASFVTQSGLLHLVCHAFRVTQYSLHTPVGNGSSLTGINVETCPGIYGLYFNLQQDFWRAPFPFTGCLWSFTISKPKIITRLM